ncbi:MAG: hypothetical protein RBR06_10460 [Desulfuromonadaceae bacterium]|nr:hypothetical protein [Desulfuromonadaceae bacterium]
MCWRRVGINSLMLLVILPLYLVLQGTSWEQRAEVRRTSPPGYTLPAAFSRVLAMGYQGLLSDYEFLRAMTFYGDRSIKQQQMSSADWDFFAYSLDVVTDLDPYFLDPYVLGEGLLTWDTQRYETANALLRKGMRYRTWDWQLPYYVGFNHFYFLSDYATGSDYLMQAAKIPDSPAFLATLAARLAYYGGKSKTAVFFLQQMLAETNSEALRQRMGKRLLALQGAVLIEDALKQYRNVNSADPEALGELVRSGYLEELPQDPYGGQWTILQNGRVYSTSKFVDAKSDNQGN